MKSISACNHPNDRLTKSADRKWEVGFLIACIITDTIGLHEVLLAVNYNYENLRKKKEEKQPLVISFHKKNSNELCKLHNNTCPTNYNDITPQYYKLKILQYNIIQLQHSHCTTYLRLQGRHIQHSHIKEYKNSSPNSLNCTHSYLKL